MVDRVVIESTPVSGPDKPAAGVTDTKPADQKPVDQKPAAPSSEQRPAWLPDNFKTGEDLAKSYAELQAQYTKLKQGEKPTEEKKPDGNTDSEKKPDDEAAKATDEAEKKEKETADALKSKGIDVDGMSKRFWESGKLADTDVAELEKIGITRAAAQEFADAMVAKRDARDAQLLGEVGGKEGFDKIAGWAKAGYEPAKLQAFNEAMTSGNFGQMQQAMVAIKVAYEAANGKDATLRIGGDAPTGSDVTVYRSTAEMQKDMNDPRYKTDPAFREDVYAKIKRSKIM